MAQDNHFQMQKLIRGSLHDRDVFITTDLTNGKAIKIYSKNNDLNDHNIIQLFLKSPCEYATIKYGKKIMKFLVIQRKLKNPVYLTSNNDLVVTTIYDSIIKWIEETHKCQGFFNKCIAYMLNSLARCVHTLQLKKNFELQINNSNTNNKKLINAVSLGRAKISIRYLAHLLENGKIGYFNLKKMFFNMWFNQWNSIAVRNIIRTNHKLIQRKLGFFNGAKTKKDFGMRYKNNINDIHSKLQNVNDDVTKITTNLTQLINSRNITDDIQIDTVNNLQQIADLRHRVETINNSGEEFIVIGDQSSGKSSLLCMLLGVNIAYTDSLFATRCPVRYLLEPCDPKMGWKFEWEEPKTKTLTIVSQGELQKKLISHFKGTIGKNIVFDPITIKIWSPTCTSSMTLVDLPGLVGRGDTAEKQEQHKKSYAIVREYLNKSNIFILFVHRFDVDIGSLNTSILDEVKNRNKNNVIYCLTHFDRCCSDKDITYDNIYNNVLQCSSEIANGSDMFLLSLSKAVSDLKEKEDISSPTIRYLREHYGDILETRNIHFNLDSVKIFLRKKLHRHVLEISTVLQEFLYKQKDILLTEFNIYNDKYLVPKVTEEILERFNTLFKNKTQKLLKGHLIPEKRISEHCFFEDLQTEVKNANVYSMRNNINVWPSIIMLRKSKIDEMSNTDELQEKIIIDETNKDNTEAMNKQTCEDTTKEDDLNNSKSSLNDSKELSKKENTILLPVVYDGGLDFCLKRDLISHALYTRTVYELQKRLCCIEVKPSKEDIIHGITYDPNINLDTPKDSAHCVMQHTVKQQLNMNGFFEYAIKRFEYITYKIIRYSIWNINNTDDKDNTCLTLMDNEEFQYMFEIEINKYVENLCTYTREKFVSSFDEIMNSPIVMSHADRYKKMLINDFDWDEKDIEACNNEDIFRPKNIGVHKVSRANEVQQEDNTRIDQICNLIKLHIHVRLLMMCELMTIHIDFNWRRMLDDSKESSKNDGSLLIKSIFDHIRLNVCKNISINKKDYSTDQLLKIYNGNSECKIEIDQRKVDDIEELLEKLHECNEKMPELLYKSVSIAGDKFL